MQRPLTPRETVAADPSGGQIGTGIGGTAAEALALLRRRPTETPTEYATEPPF